MNELMVSAPRLLLIDECVCTVLRIALTAVKSYKKVRYHQHRHKKISHADITLFTIGIYVSLWWAGEGGQGSLK